MKQLSGLDNVFLELERGNVYMHVAGLGIYDPSTAPGGKVRFKQILNFFTDRLDQARVFRRRLVVPPLAIDRPYWVDDGELDVEYHVRHIALPHPGDWRQLMIQTARIHARPLDRNKPLWEVYVIEGLDNIPGIAPGSFALYIKFHHAAVDGEAGAQIIKAIHSPTPESSAGIEHKPLVADRDPTRIEFYARAIGHHARQAVDAAKLAAQLGTRVALAGKDMIETGKAMELAMSLLEKRLSKAMAGDAVAAAGSLRKPSSRFDGKVSAHRVVDAVGFSMAECKTIREHVADITINDIFLAATGGGVRRYLEAKGELPAQSLVAMMPISTRGAVKDMEAGNQIGFAPVRVRSDIADPIERLIAVHGGAARSKSASAKIGADLPAKIVNLIPAFAAARLLSKANAAANNMTVSNVRGPDMPLYMAGAKLQVFLPVSIPFDGMGINVTGFSYDGILWVCYVACRAMVPDPAFLTQCLKESFDEMVAAAKAHGRAATAPKAKAVAVRKTKAAPVKAASRKAAASTKAKAATPARTKAGARAAAKPAARRAAKPKPAAARA